MAATNQKYLPISFAIDDGDGGLDYLTLPIRPEELTRTEPSRTTAVNALDGAWVDSFGRGLTTITISGHTGWGAANRPDGAYQFARLRTEFINTWHELRADRIERGLDPDDVRLIFIDALNGQYVADVVPTNFVLRRSKSQPLLMMYNISLTVTNDRASNPYPELLEEQRPNDATEAEASIGASMSILAGLDGGLAGILADIGDLGKNVLSFTQATLKPALDLAQDVIRTANLTKSVISAAGNLVIQEAATLSAACNKMWEAVGSVVSIPNHAKAELMKVKGAISNLSCCLSNGFENAIRPIDYSALYGSSNCSSTSTGRPASAITLAGGSAFEAISTYAAPLILVSPGAASALAAIKSLDIVQAIDQAELSRHVSAARSGVSFG